MPLSIQPLATLRQQQRASMATRLPGADVTLRRSVLNVVADVTARALFDTNNALANWYARQLFTATKEAGYLDIEAGEYGLARQAATAAAGNAIFTGTSGVNVPAATPLETSDGAVQFVTAAGGDLSTGTLTLPVVAVTLGSAGNLPAAAPLTITTGIAGVVPTAVLDGAGTTGGADQETDASLRGRLIARKSFPPQGGAWWDYVAWAKNVAGVTRAWVYPLTPDFGDVQVLFVMDGRADNIPLAADIAAVQAAIDANRPVTASATVIAPVPDPLSITIAGLNPSAQQTAVAAQLAALARAVAPGGAQLGDGVSATAPGGYLFLSQIDAAVQGAGGIVSFDLTAPVADIVYSTTHLPAAPTVTFT